MPFSSIGGHGRLLLSNHVDVTAGALLRALLAAVAELELDLVVFAFRQFGERVVRAVHPACLAVHAHAARHAALGLRRAPRPRARPCSISVSSPRSATATWRRSWRARSLYQPSFMRSGLMAAGSLGLLQRRAAQPRVDGFGGEPALADRDRHQPQVHVVAAGVTRRRSRWRPTRPP